MEDKSITIKKVDYNKLYNLYGLIEELYGLINKYKIKSQELTNEIEKLEKEVKIVEEENIKRINTWKSLLNHYYQATLHKTTPYGEYTLNYYIYPYRVIEENDTVWVLKINPEDTYDGGVKDTYFVIDDEDWNYDITLNEISSSEFNEIAVKMAISTIETRLEKQKQEKNDKLD